VVFLNSPCPLLKHAQKLHKKIKKMYLPTSFIGYLPDVHSFLSYFPSAPLVKRPKYNNNNNNNNQILYLDRLSFFGLFGISWGEAGVQNSETPHTTQIICIKH
jgi:hypothetical protein